MAVGDSTDANGRGTIAFGDDTFHFRTLKGVHDGTDYPLVWSATALVGVVQQVADPTLFVLCFDDGPAPGGGRLVQGVGVGGWAEASVYSLDACVFTTCWHPGPITVTVGGAPQVGGYCDMTKEWSTAQGTHEGGHQPFYPYNGLYVHPVTGVVLRNSSVDLGSFKTDGSGVLWAHRPDGTLDPIFIPRGYGAVGHRAQDRWPGCPVAERELTATKIWGLQEFVEIAEGGSYTLDIAAVSITINGPASANALLEWEDGPLRPTPETAYQLDGTGTLTLTNLPPGRYVIGLYHPTDYDKWLLKQEVEATVSGGAYTVNFGAWNVVPSGKTQLIAYAYGAQPAVGAQLYAMVGPSGFEVYTVIATTGGDGTALVDGIANGMGVDDNVVLHATWGAATCGQTLAQVIDVTLAARFGAICSASTVDFPEGVVLWGGYAGEHVNLPIPERAAYLEDELTGDRYWIGRASAGHGTMSDPIPRGRWTAPNPSSTWTTRTYKICDGDGEVLATGQYIAANWTPLWTDVAEARRATASGGRLSLVLGGKPNGVALEYAPTILTEDVLVEPERYGLETGDHTQPLEVRTYREDLEEEVGNSSRRLCFQNVECPYCGGPLWTWPTADGYWRGLCMQCQDYGVATDGRAYFTTPTLQAGSGWLLRFVRSTTAGQTRNRQVVGWPRSEEYFEVDEYLVDDWKGFGIPRWVAVHLGLGGIAAGVFVSGESIADAEARLGRTVGPVQIKLQLTGECTATTVIRVTAVKADGTGNDVRDITVPAGSQAGDLFFLNQGPHDTYPGVPCRWYTEILDADEISGDLSVVGVFVNDGPAWNNSTGVVVAHGAFSPYAVDLLFLSTLKVAIDIDNAGRIWRAKYDEDLGRIVIQARPMVSAPWPEAWGGVQTDGEASDVNICGSGNYLLLAFRDSRGGRYFYSVDAGRSFTEVDIDMAGEGLRMKFDGLRRHFLEILGGNVMYKRFIQLRGAAIPFADGTYQKAVCAASSADLDFSGNFLAVDTGDSTYISEDGGESWQDRTNS